MTLNEIAENIAYGLGEQFNDTLKESLKHSIIVYRAKLIKDDLSRNFMSYVDYLQSFNVALTKVNKIDACSTCKILRTTEKVAKPLKVKVLGKTSFKYVGTVDFNTPFVYAHFEEFPFLNHLQYQHQVIYYTWENGYIYILNNLRLCSIRVQAVFADPRDINMSCEESKDMFKDDRDFPISEDLLVTIRKGIISGDFQLIKDGKEVELRNDD